MSNNSYPLPLLPSTSVDINAIDSREALPCLMAFMKNTLIRGLNRIFAFSPQVSASDPKLAPFLDYSRSVIKLLDLNLQGDYIFFTSNSAGESLEKALGPACNPDFIRVRDQLAALDDVLGEWIKNYSLYSVDSLREYLTFGPLMVSCMQSQLRALAFERISAAVSDKDLREMIQVNVEWFASQSDISFLLPFVISHHDPSTSPYWPTVHEQGTEALPSLLKQHQECWQFAPLDPLTRLPVAQPSH
ncbi:hypothetical protein HYDPIDRAFT_109780 [Hydnomerulius pinastri MD-312]|nr:hypothetical protein HYDPIDRAFT_109780 [Hydnomerulius pinastri MD-312]